MTYKKIMMNVATVVIVAILLLFLESFMGLFFRFIMLVSLVGIIMWLWTSAGDKND